MKLIVDNQWIALLDFLYPIRCVGCRKPGEWFCSSCTLKIKPLNTLTCINCEKPAINGFTHPKCKTPQSLDCLISAFEYKGPIAGAIKQLKYRSVTSLADTLVKMSLEEFLETGIIFGEEMIIVPVPLHWIGKWKRGFNQAKILAGAFSEQLDLETKADFLKRTKYTVSQTSLSGKKRKENVRNAFAVNKKKRKEIKGRSFLLVDDVCTTGSTLRECAKVLKRAGARHVWGMSIAKG